MPGFYVLGVSKQKLDELISRRVAAMEDRLKRPPQPGSTERRKQKVLSKIQQRPPYEVLSHEFSVPQFCNDFIDLIPEERFQFLAIASREGRTWQIHQSWPDLAGQNQDPGVRWATL